jgi:hypothetical protein
MLPHNFQPKQHDLVAVQSPVDYEGRLFLVHFVHAYLIIAVVSVTEYSQVHESFAI